MSKTDAPNPSKSQDSPVTPQPESQAGATPADPKQGPQLPAPVKAKQGSPKRRVAQVITGLCVTGLVAGVGVFGDSVQLPQPELIKTGTSVQVAAAQADLVCPTPVSLATIPAEKPAQTDTEQDDTTLGDFDADQRATTNQVQTALVGAGGKVTFGDMGTPIDSQSESQSNQDQDPQSIDPLEAQAPSSQRTVEAMDTAVKISTDGRAIVDSDNGQFTAASQASVTTQGDTRGIAGAACGTTSTEHWLVGGGTSLGTSSKLVVQNPGRTAATVAITVWGPSGRVPLAGLDTLLVPAGKQVSVFLEGIAPEQRRTAVHVASTGTLISAYMQVNSLDGISPKGIDYVTSGNGPTTVQVLTGVTIGDPENEAQEPSTVRLVTPDFSAPVDLGQQEEEEASEVTTEPVGSAQITLLGDKGQFVLFGADQIDLSPGTVTDVDLTGVPAGSYSVVVRADIPVLAGARSTLVGEEDPDRPLFGTPEDYMWVHASPALDTYLTAQEAGSAAEPKAPENQSSQPHSAPAQTAQPQNSPSQDIETQEFSPHAVQGALATVAGLDSTLVLTALPQAKNLDELNQAFAAVPRFYATDVEAGTEQETEAELAIRDAWKQDAKVKVTTFGPDGQELVAKEVSLAVGQTLSVNLKDFGGDQVRAVVVIPQTETVIDWAVVNTAADLPGAIGVTQPITSVQEPLEVRVTRSLSVGIN